MMKLPSLTRSIGQTERALRSLLHRHLEGTGLDFPSSAALNILSHAGCSTRDDLERLLVDGRIVQQAKAAAAVDHLLTSGFIETMGVAATGSALPGPNPDFGPDDGLRISPTGEDISGSVRQEVARTTLDLFGDLPAADVDATGRTLKTVHHGAQRLLGLDH